jgi:hypothetical protein
VFTLLIYTKEIILILNQSEDNIFVNSKVFRIIIAYNAIIYKIITRIKTQSEREREGNNE